MLFDFDVYMGGSELRIDREPGGSGYAFERADDGEGLAAEERLAVALEAEGVGGVAVVHAEELAGAGDAEV